VLVKCIQGSGGQGNRMPFTRRPLQSTVAFVVVNALLCISVGPVYDFVCDLPYWERRVCMYILSWAFCLSLTIALSLSFSPHQLLILRF